MNLKIAICFSLTLAGCGGGGGTATGTPIGPIHNQASVVFQVGDSLTYANAPMPSNLLPTWVVDYERTETLTQKPSDTTTVWNKTSSNAPGSLVTLDPNGQVVSVGECTNSPAATSPIAPYAVGQTYKFSWVVTCYYHPGLSESQVTLTGSVSALESISTPAGVFEAFKFTENIVVSDGSSTTTNNSSCWRDVELNRNVLCNTTIAFKTAPDSYSYRKLEDRS